MPREFYLVYYTSSGHLKFGDCADFERRVVMYSTHNPLAEILHLSITNTHFWKANKPGTVMKNLLLKLGGREVKSKSTNSTTEWVKFPPETKNGIVSFFKSHDGRLTIQTVQEMLAEVFQIQIRLHSWEAIKNLNMNFNNKIH
eukprot:TRINITY_DN9532_c0_g1_i1.p1 TRINITY_DN9532_c0_g1~~TRINITY_DN9532_c0_g1_i1.p1  ORF type:complete len:143 (+),score=13.65 TRINITY_DN9532_c0_g1_i1:401-829(+)